MKNQEIQVTEISSPEFENDFLKYISVESKNLSGRGDICVFVPPGAEKLTDCPLVILLTGVQGHSWSWSLRSGIHFSVLEMIKKKLIPPLVIAMPSDGLLSGDGSACLLPNNFNFEKWIAEDVPAAIKKSIPAISGKSKLFIGGLSMGGFGAFKIGAKYHNIFTAIAAHSSIINQRELKLVAGENFSDFEQEDKSEEGVLDTLLKYKHRLPPFSFDCGAADTLLESNRLLHQQLIENNIAHDYEEYEGGHEWAYWQEHIIDSMLFFSRYFSAEKDVEVYMNELKQDC
jgi:putative tributyrin esterase